MSGCGDDRRRDKRRGDFSGGRRRSVSPRDDRRGQGDDRSYSSRGSSSRGGRGGFHERGGRGGDGGGSSHQFQSGLPDLPDSVEVPKNGGAFVQKEPKMEGTAGHRTRIIVNHYEIQSLPKVRILQYDVRSLSPKSESPGYLTDAMLASYACP